MTAGQPTGAQPGGGQVERAYLEAFRLLALHPKEEVVNLWFPAAGPPDWCVTARRLPGRAPVAVYFQPSPGEEVIWLEDRDADALWARANAAVGQVVP